jgi:hypothetical protein
MQPRGRHASSAVSLDKAQRKRRAVAPTSEHKRANQPRERLVVSAQIRQTRDIKHNTADIANIPSPDHLAI